MLQRTAGNRAVAGMLQRLELRDSGCWSNSRHYVVGHNKMPARSPLKTRHKLGIADGAERPRFPGATWVGEGTITDGRVRVPAYRLGWESGGPVQIPKDCLTTAELVAAWLGKMDPEKIGEIRKVPQVLQYIPRRNASIKLKAGDILFHIHDEKVEGDFHGAAIIAEDKGDVVTMESDASRDQIQATAPIFDMYKGRRGFELKQARKGGRHERTYIISFLKTPDARSDTDMLFPITGMEFSGRATTAVEKIKKAIQAALASEHADKSSAGKSKAERESKKNE